MISFIEDDGGRAAAGFRGQAGDCGVRALAIATGRPYREVYDELFEVNRTYGQQRRNRAARSIQRHGASPRDGITKAVYKDHLERLGLEWTPTMGIGTGCTVHVRADELPPGRLILSLSGHYAAVIDGVLHDTYDCSREGTRCVYGYWKAPC